MSIHRFATSPPYVSVSLMANGLLGDYVALIDTGASMSAVHPEIIEAFHGKPFGGVDLQQVNADGTISRSWVPTYLFDMVFDGVRMRAPVEVIAASSASPCDMLIGRDYMGRWLMAWNGPKDGLAIPYRMGGHQRGRRTRALVLSSRSRSSPRLDFRPAGITAYNVANRRG